MIMLSKIIITVGVIFVASGILLKFLIFPKLINSKIDESIKLEFGSEAYERWETIPIPLKFKVYFFNVTNRDKVQLGHKPKVVEVGPYVYDQFVKKGNIIEDGENLRYRQNSTFVFNKIESAPLKENDPLTVANLPLMSIINGIELEEPATLKVFQTFIDVFANNPRDLFLETTPKQFLFDGIPFNCKAKRLAPILKTICNKIEEKAPAQLKRVKREDGEHKRDNLVFALLAYKNNSDDGLYEINNGLKNIELLGDIKSWNGSPNLTVWKENSTCNKIYGTDTTIFPPHRNYNSVIRVFQSDICRSVNLYYDQEVTYKNIPALRYVVKDDMLGSPKNFSKNQCFCLKKTKGILGEDECLLDGAMEMQTCQSSPIVLTLPQFYLAHEKYKNTVEGFNPNRSLHETFVDIEPDSGVVLRGSKRAQFNIFYRPIQNITLTKNFTMTLMPVVWIDQGVELHNTLTDMLKNELLVPKSILEKVNWSIIGVGLFVGFVGIIFNVFIQRRKDL